MSPSVKDEHKVLQDHLPPNYKYEFEWYIEDSKCLNDMTIEIYLFYSDELVDYFYCDLSTLPDTISLLIETANSDYRDQKITRILNG
jgi:hypothetical protein